MGCKHSSLADGGMKNKKHKEEEEEDDDCDDMPDPPPPPKNLGKRGTVSAQKYDMNMKDYVPKEYPKTEEQEAGLRKILKMSLLFQELDDEQLEKVIKDVESVTFQPDDVVIKQGDDGDCLYVVAEGAFDCLIKFDGATEEKKVKTCKTGDVFGELALLYKCKRKATVKCVGPESGAFCWKLDQMTFQCLVKGAAAQRIKRTENTLSQVTLFEHMSAAEIAKIADVIKSKRYADGEVIVKEGDAGDTFYIVDMGFAHAYKALKPGQPQSKVKEYSQGDYFGELALLRNQPRAATIKAKGPCRCLFLDRDAFTRLLGNLEEVMQRGAKEYENAKAIPEDDSPSSGAGGSDKKKKDKDKDQHVTIGKTTVVKEKNKKKKKKDESDDEDEDEDEDYEPPPPPKTIRKRGTVVADRFKPDPNYVAPVFEKTPEQEAILIKILFKSWLFASLDDQAADKVVKAVELVKCAPDFRIINQGDDGDCLYIIEDGIFEVKIANSNGHENTVKICQSGDVFGELALLYNAPRKASVQCRGPNEALVWKLDRSTFLNIVKGAAQKRIKQTDQTLMCVTVFENLDDNERAKIADAVKLEKFRDGENIITEGEEGDKFFIVDTGSAYALKGDVRVKEYSQGDYFGELALLNSAPRAATVKAQGNVSCLTLTSDAFKRLLGGLDDILKREAEEYKKVAA